MNTKKTDEDIKAKLLESVKETNEVFNIGLIKMLSEWKSWRM